MNTLPLLRKIRRDPITFAQASGIALRPYQQHIALAVKDSVIHHKGLTFVVILPRQSGKNEVQRHLFAWLLYRAASLGGTIVSVAPTFKPQTVNAMERIRLTLDANPATRGAWQSSAGFIFRFHRARLQFFSGESKSRVVGATADLLLSVDEAQDIDPLKFDKEFDPMTASTNATRIFWGTAWTSQTLLARQARIAKEEQRRDGLQRLFYYTGDEVAQLVPEYAAHLERVIRERGRQHPLVRTQYFNEDIDAVAGMFTPERMALMTGDPLPSPTRPSGAPFAKHPRNEVEGAPNATPSLPPPNVGDGVLPDDTHARHLGEAAKRPRSAAEGVPKAEGVGPHLYAFCIDVAGQDEQSVSIDNQQSTIDNSRDSTTLSVIQIDLSTLETLHAPTYRVVHRHAWTGISHVALFGQLKALAENWNPQHIVIDATGVGEGLWSLLDRAFPRRVIPVKFSAREKSEIGWRFLSIIETGRFKAFTTPAGLQPPSRSIPEAERRGSIIPAEAGSPLRSDNLQSTINNEEIARLQYLMCQSEILPGPTKTLRWGVPDGTRGPDGSLVHDDFVLADSLIARLDELRWSVRFEPFVIPAKDPLEGMDRFGDE